MSNTWTLNESEAKLNDEFSEHGIMSTKAMSSVMRAETKRLLAVDFGYDSRHRANARERDGAKRCWVPVAPVQHGPKRSVDNRVRTAD